eukprot:jgi/Psemu1/52817/gm1.52817_g
MKRRYDPVIIGPKTCQKLQLTRELKVERKASFHPSVGGSKGYNLWFIQQQMERHQNGEPVNISIASLYRWNHGITPYRMTGNKDRDLLVGPDLISLVACIIIYPEVQLDERVAMYLCNNGVRLYSNQLISQRLKELQITNKKTSIKAFKAYSPVNMRREFLFWNRQLSIGVTGIPRKHFLDVVEFAMEAKWLNRSNSWAICFRQVWTVGNYDKGQKLTMMIAVKPGDPELPADVTGNIARPHRWADARRVAGTTGDSFASFIGSICTSIKDHQRVTETNVDDWRVFLWENLSSHYSPIIYETIMGRVDPPQFDILPCLAYQPKYELIKYVICLLLSHMKVNVTGESDLNQMEQQILDMAAAIGSFDATFTHCGYSEDGVYPSVEIPINPNANPPGWGPLGTPGAELPPVALA